jgi:hypothetical protein
MPRLPRTVCLVPLLAVLACTAPAADGEASSANAITDVPPGAVRDQRETGNCWLYTTAAWVENLEYQALIEKGRASAGDPSTRPPQLSVSYFDYWDWYDKITSGALKGKVTGEDLDSGGTWGEAVELISKHGLVRAKSFGVVSTAGDADLTTRALKAMVRSLTTGALKTAAARKNETTVRAELDAAFKVKMWSLSSSILRAEDLQVIAPRADGRREVRTLAEVIGTRAAPADDADKRTGDVAWSDVAFEPKSPADTRAFFKRVQRALHANVPLPVGWYYPDNADPGGTGQFVAAPTEPGTEEDSVEHETLLTDYTVENVPGFGRLEAGTVATEEQKKAALDDAAQIVFFRVADSYGVLDGRKTKKTSDDLYVKYLLGTAKACPKGAAATSRKCTTHSPLLLDVTFPAGF